jgi:UDP:flavonoid glycosyltransferase YjiC (YdhE family)
LNAAAVVRLGIGRAVRSEDLSKETIARFLLEGRRFEEATKAVARDGRAEAIAAIERFALELQRGPKPKRTRAWELAL